MDPVRVVLLALLQGVAELFPVSSLGHTVIIPGLLGWGDLLRSDTFLPLVVTLHLGTALALLTFFWRDWVNLLRGGVKVLIAGRFTPDVDPQGYGRQLALVIVGTLPAGLIGVLFQTKLEALFGAPILAAAFLCMNGAVLLAAERLTRRQRYIHAQSINKSGVTLGATALQGGAYQSAGDPVRAVDDAEFDQSLHEMSFVQAMLIGLAQSFGLFPGISRSGITMVAGMSIGLSHESAARFSFLLATPIILGAGLLEIPKLFGEGTQILVLALVGGVIAGVAAYLSVRFLMRYFETKSLDPFAYYCLGAGLLAFGFFLAQYLGLLA
jgi:undecaprenyl-diphosphatase